MIKKYNIFFDMLTFKFLNFEKKYIFFFRSSGPMSQC